MVWDILKIHPFRKNEPSRAIYYEISNKISISLQYSRVMPLYHREQFKNEFMFIDFTLTLTPSFSPRWSTCPLPTIPTPSPFHQSRFRNPCETSVWFLRFTLSIQPHVYSSTVHICLAGKSGRNLDTETRLSNIVK